MGPVKKILDEKSETPVPPPLDDIEQPADELTKYGHSIGEGTESSEETHEIHKRRKKTEQKEAP